MKKLYVLFIAIGLLSSSCMPGPPGPPGFDGYDGIDGVDGEEGYVFEYEFSFTAPDYSVTLNLPNDFNMLDSDVMMVYFLWEILEDDTEIWRALPQTLFFTDGLLHYNYDFTKYDANVFLDGTVSLDGLGAAYTDNWIARAVVIPAQYGGRSDLDITDYNQVKEFFGLSGSKLAKAGYTKRPK